MTDGHDVVDVVEVVRAGILTTVQDLGRPGLGRFGVSASGALDDVAHRLACVLAGNPATAAALEITGPGTTLRFLRRHRFALAGADLDARLDEVALTTPAAVVAAAGATLTFSFRRRGARAALAINGDLAVPRPFGSAATDVAGALGGVGPGAGTPLRAGTRLRVRAGSPGGPLVDGGPIPDPVRIADSVRALAPLLPVTVDPGLVTHLRYIAAPDAGIAVGAQAAFAAMAVAVSPRSNRTGFRFEGDALPVIAAPLRLSEPNAPGTIQLPPDGHPILLMADRNTTGGYPRLGHLCSADRSRAAQLWPGDRVRFVPVTLAEARHVTRTTEALVQRTLRDLSA